MLEFFIEITYWELIFLAGDYFLIFCSEETIIALDWVYP